MLRILILQTTRMGDVLQTSPLVRRVRLEHPDAHIAILVRKMGKVVAQHHPDINEVIIYDEDDLYLHMKSKDSDRLLRAYELADAFMARIKDGHYDIAYNVTHSISSAMLVKLAGIPKVIGAHLSEDWQFILRGPWTTYFYTSVFNREYNDLNLCDILHNFAVQAPEHRQLVFELEASDRAFAAEFRREHGIADDDFVVCMQLGASESNKRWPAHRFAELAQLLREKHGAKILLAGVQEEAPLGDEFEQSAPGLAIPLYGKTTIPQLAALLERANVLVTNDTGTMHIAAAVKCPVTLVSVGHVHYRETGPYGAGHCAIEWRRRSLGRSDHVPGALEERELVRPDQVYRAMQMAIAAHAGDAFAQIAETPELAEVDLYLSRFAPDRHLQFYPVIRRPMVERDFLRVAYRAMWLDHLAPTQAKAHEKESLRAILRCYDAPESSPVAAWAELHGKAFAQLADKALGGTKTTEELLDILKKHKGMDRAKQRVSELMALDEDMRLFSELHPACRPLIQLARYERDNLEGADPLVLAQTTLEIYRSCYARARLMAQKIQRCAEVRD